MSRSHLQHRLCSTKHNNIAEKSCFRHGVNGTPNCVVSAHLLAKPSSTLYRPLSLQLILITLLVFSLQFLSANAQYTLYVSPKGDDSNSGTSEKSPLGTLKAARDAIRKIRKGGSLPKGGARVRLLSGVYNYDSTLELTSEDSGDGPDAMIVYESYGGRATFEGGAEIGGWEKAGSDVDGRVGKGAKGKVYMTKVEDKRVLSVLDSEKGDRALLTSGGELLRIARWPNKGFALIGKVRKGKETPGAEGSVESPKGAEFKIRDGNGAVDRWRDELREKPGKAKAIGYVDSDFRRLFLRVFGVNGDYLRLMDGGGYGIESDDKRDNKPRRFFVRNLMAELDSPGEWYFDESDKMLYMYPIGEMGEDTTITIGVAPCAFAGSGVSYVAVKNIAFQHKEPGVGGQDSFVLFEGEGKGNVVEGCVFRDSASCGVTMEESLKEVTIRDSDFYNLEMFFRIGGGVLSPTEITSHKQQAINNHCTITTDTFERYPTIAVKGVGTRFENNLIHNVPNQVINIQGGCDHMVARNEVFNTGFEEGDGGAFYGGGALWSYGNIFRHNFMHHMISVPDLFPRAAFYSDDHDGGETYQENVLYKGGGDGIKINKGGGHIVANNVILKGDVGIWSSSRGSKDDFKLAMDYLKNDPDSGDKKNYFGRAQKVWGKDGWKQGPWKKYKELQIVMNKYFSEETMEPFECRFYYNLFSDCDKDIDAPSSVSERDNRDISLSLFEDPDSLNFRFKAGKPEYAPDIPFESIGLVVDGSRKWVPDKKAYRSSVRKRFEEIDVNDNGGYSTAKANELLYYNSGAELLSRSEGRAPFEA